ncbi:MAG TPA: hypothetical protein PLA68_09325, partial [Panacibacter sp.]|nr:hypothetical protein [Panacibacter sp.]
MRCLSNGHLDDSFGENGVVETFLPTIYRITATAIQTDGKIIVGGRSFFSSYVLIRYLPDGRIDSTFDEDKDGIASLALETADQYAVLMNDIIIQSDGKILAAGSGGSRDYLMAIARFNSDGSVDSAFGDKIGYSLLQMQTGYSKAYTVEIQHDKKIVLTGIYYTGINTGFGVARYNTDGSLGSSFGENGVATTGIGNLELAIDVGNGALQNDGKIVVGGAVWIPHDQDITRVALVRFNNEINNPPEFAKIQKWQGHYGFSWNDWPGNKTTYYSVGRSTNASSFTEIAQVT